MSVKKSRPTKHALMRISQRTDLPTKNLNKTIAFARRNGKNTDDPSFSKEFKEYLNNKRISRDKIVKVYLGYVWIFNRTSTGLITIYPVPDKFKK